MSNDFLKLLTLDGGGAKGIYSIGILFELEKLLGEPLYKAFDLIYGVSTGSIITSLIALGYSTEEIYKLYVDIVPKIKRNQGVRVLEIKS